MVVILQHTCRTYVILKHLHGGTHSGTTKSPETSNYTTSHLSIGFVYLLCKLQKRCIRLAFASDKVYQLLAHGRWFFPGTPASSTTKTGRHDIAEILLKVALKHQKSINQSNSRLELLTLYCNT